MACTLRHLLLTVAPLLAAPLAAQTPTASTPARDTAAAARRAADNARPSLRAARLSGQLRIDGRLDEPAWAAAPAATEFTQSYPESGKPPTQRTEARILYDDAALYVGVRMFDTRPDSIAAQLARRDASGIYSDWLHVVIDSYYDRRTAFRFTVNPRGVQKDVFHSNDTNEDLSWDAVWQVATVVDSLGWTAEYRIPFSQLRFGPAKAGAERVWGLQIQRDIARREERDSWSPWTLQSGGYVSRAGDLTGLVGIPTPRRLELLPYVSASLTRAPDQPGNPFYRANDAAPSVGADVKAGLPLGLTLTATVNPDFGQVEVDPAVINLSAFESFFPEKRPFFTEGADVFRFGQVRSFNNYNFEQFFYTRRIGREPQRNAILAGSSPFVDAPPQTTILGAAKVSGKVGPWTVGVLDALTAGERARYLDEDDTRVTTPVEPRSNYFAGRLRRDLRGGATVVGAMLTGTTRDLSDPVFQPLLRDNAWFGGVDFEQSWAKRAWALGGYLAATRVSGSPEAILATQRAPARYYQRPDADYLALDPGRTTLGGTIGEAVLSHTGRWDLSLGYKQVSPGFELNDLGFMGRADYRVVSTLFGWNVQEPRGSFRRYNYYTFQNVAWNFGSDRIFQGYGVGANAQLKNLWNLGMQARYLAASANDRLTRGGPLARNPAQWSVNANASTDARKRVFLGAYGSSVRDEVGGWSRSLGVDVNYRPSTNVQLSVGPSLSRQRDTQQFFGSMADSTAAATFGRRYTFAQLDQTTWAMDTRLDWTFTPTLSLQLFAQPFIATGDYSTLKTLRRPGTLEYDPAGEAPVEADFNYRSLRGNAVLRWEYRPGSALFLVWQQDRSGVEGIGDFEFGRDVGALFREPARNVFLLKATYWLGR